MFLLDTIINFIAIGLLIRETVPTKESRSANEWSHKNCEKAVIIVLQSAIWNSRVEYLMVWLYSANQIVITQLAFHLRIRIDEEMSL